MILTASRKEGHSEPGDLSIVYISLVFSWDFTVISFRLLCRDLHCILRLRCRIREAGEMCRSQRTPFPEIPSFRLVLTWARADLLPSEAGSPIISEKSLNCDG
jgi:hypothetical protein